jgi:hypothetical protein
VTATNPHESPKGTDDKRKPFNYLGCVLEIVAALLIIAAIYFRLLPAFAHASEPICFTGNLTPNQP